MAILLQYLAAAAFIGIGARTLASPIAARQTSGVTTNQTATFENVTSSGFGEGPTLPGVYKDLYFGLFEQGPYDYAAGQPTGIAPQSFPSLAVFGYSFTNPGPASLTRDYANSTVQTFQLFDFYFGCQAEYNYTYPGGSELMLYPQPCILHVLGERDEPAGYFGSVPNATFKFVPEYEVNSRVGVNYSTMMHVMLPDTFRGLTSVYFNATSDAETALSDPAVYVDNVAFAVTAFPAR